MQMKLPHELKSEETKKKIMDAAKEILERYDFKYLTVRNICKESGVAYGSFYHHFGTKENVLYQLISQYLEKIWQENPVPDWIDPDDYIRTCLWFFVVYGKFCGILGKEIFKYLYMNCPQDPFEEIYEREIHLRLEHAFEMGYLDPGRNRIPENDHPVTLLVKDLTITYKGLLLWWCTNEQESEEPLHETMEHLCFNMLFSYRSDRYQADERYPHLLLSELPQYEGSIVIDNFFEKRKTESDS